MPKLFQLLTGLEPDELSELQLFLHTPFFNTRESLRQLLEELRPFYPNFRLVNKAALLAGQCPDERSHQQFINEQFSALSRLVEQFLVQQSLKQSPGQQHQLLLHAYQTRNMPRHYIKAFKKWTTELKSQYPLHWEDSHSLWQSYHHLHNYFEAAELADLQTDNLRYLGYLDEYFILVKLRHICNARAARAYLNQQQKLEIPFFNAILQEAQNHYGHHPIIQLYLQMIQLLQDWQQDLFDQTESHFRALYTELETGEKYFILLSLINLANQQMTKGQPELIQNIFRLFEHAISHQLFLNHCPLTTNTFLNICTVGGHTGAADWTTSFIQTHQHLIQDPEQEIVVDLGRALLHFHTQSFDRAYELIRPLRSRQLQRKLRIRTLTVRCLLELLLQDLSYYQVLRANVGNFNQFINRSSRLSQSTKQSYRNFTRTIMKIAGLRQFGWDDNAKHQELSRYIQQLKPLITRKWLLQKLRL